MKKVYILIAISLFLVLISAKAMTDEYEEIAQSDQVNVTLYAKRMDGLFTDFKLDFQGIVFSKPYWINTTNSTWFPQIINEDINQDGKNELIIILTKGSGTGILEREVHVFHIQKQLISKKSVEVPVEVLVDDPIAIILKNVKTELVPNKANISIGNKKYTIDLKPLDLKVEHLFTDIFFGNSINY